MRTSPLSEAASAPFHRRRKRGSRPSGIAAFGDMAKPAAARSRTPMVQAAMGGHVSLDMPVAVSAAGGLGSFPSAGFTPAQINARRSRKNPRQVCTADQSQLFCHATPQRDEASGNAWRRRLAPYYVELGVDPPASPTRVLMPFGAEMCDTVIELKPDVVGFHFGLPEKSLVDRIKATGCMVFSSATTAAEARFDHHILSE